MKNPILTLKNMTLEIPGAAHTILQNINYEVFANDFVVVLGSNGSGKSSLLKLLDKTYQPSSGHILLNDKSLTEYSNQAFSREVITLTQNCHDSLFISLTIYENYLLVKNARATDAHHYDRKTFAEYLNQFNPKLPKKLDTEVALLSGGEKQALALALSVLYPPKILLLDEHTSALDPKTAEQLMKITSEVIVKNNITCIMTTHDLDIAKQYGNRILALRQGKIYRRIDVDKHLQNEKILLEDCY